jgi:heat shock protein HspQ
MPNSNAKFSVGELIHHHLFDYRGVIFDVDPEFQGSEEWYAQMARSRPPKDEPWYHVLVHNAMHTTYVAERNLELDTNGDPIRNPMIDELFDGFEAGRYLIRRRAN